MELDELKLAWQQLDRRLEAQAALSLHQFRESRFDRLRGRLRPLVVGQLLQISFGIALVVAGVSFWNVHRDVPHLFISGLAVHVYGVVTIIAAGITLAAVRDIDYAAPVVAIQAHLARLRRTYVMAGLVAGLPWWLLWMPVAAMLLLTATGVDLYAVVAERAQSVIWINLGVGLAGLLASTWLLHWSRDPRESRLAAVVERSLAGRSLRRAQDALDEVARFERG